MLADIKFGFGKVPGSNLGQDAGYLDRFLGAFT
jgi:hypothetical protein